MRRIRRLPFVLVMVLWLPRISPGDIFTVREDDGHTVTVQARFAGEGQGVVALERADGRFELVPPEQILKREPGPDPEPISTTEMIARLTQEFGAEKFRAYADTPYVVGLILSEPLPKNFEGKALACLKKGASFMKTVEKVFLDFVNDLNLDIEKPRFPLVLLIFETDDDFIRFTAEQTGRKGPTLGAILGFYSQLTNRLAIRMSECHTFETPLHEAIHQQVYNRGLMQRLSASPAWFNEGIATGFEGGDRINGGPLRVSSRYARAAMLSKAVNWDDVVSNDKALRGDVLVGEAYAHAWSIHWFLVTRYRKPYIEYLKRLGQKSTLQLDDDATRVSDFEQVFGKRVGKLQSEFPQALEQAARKQKVSLDETSRTGRQGSQANLAEVELNAFENEGTGALTVEGRMRNLSQIRPMSFYIVVETDEGTSAEWFLPNVASQKVVPLPKRTIATGSSKMNATQRKDGQNGKTHAIQIQVRTTVPDSETGRRWQRGEFSVTQQ